jgi:uncharacterized protein (DUF488 family)
MLCYAGLDIALSIGRVSGAPPGELWMSAAMNQLFSIGHSRHTMQQFVALLRQHDIAALADVRSAPYSKWAPQFCKEPLQSAMRSAGIDYFFLGDELGGRPRGVQFYRSDGSVAYDLRALAPDFVRGLDRLIELSSGDVVAMMCAEENPTDCHRCRLVTPALSQRNVAVAHIRADGSVVADDDLPGRKQLKLFE